MEPSEQRDWSLNSGERQTATRWEDVRVDHRARYQWADSRLPAIGHGLDVFCGTGYGTRHLVRREKGGKRTVTGIDGSKEAIEIATKHFHEPPLTQFMAMQWPFTLGGGYHFIVSFESIEHVADGPAMFAALAGALLPGGDLIFSVPCEDFLPHAGMRNEFHFKHYDLKETFDMIADCGLELIEWGGQNTYKMSGDAPYGYLRDDQMGRIVRETGGQFFIAHCGKV